MVGVVEDLGMDVVLDYSNLLEAAAGIATAGAVVAAVNDDHNHLVAAIMEVLGPRGRGFVAVRGVPQFRELRDKLLPLAKEIALMPEAQLHSFLREHGLGADVSLKHPDRPVSSFAAKLKFKDGFDLQTYKGKSCYCDNVRNTDDHCSELKLQSTMHDSDANSLKDVGSLFARLGVCMVEVGLLVARLCDYGTFWSLSNQTTKHTVGVRLEQAIQESGTAKGRLIHYHSIQEKALLTLSSKAKKNRNSKKKPSNVKKLGEIVDGCNKEQELLSILWQQWHCDYGILTVLTAPLFLKSMPSWHQVSMHSHSSSNCALNPIDISDFPPLTLMDAEPRVQETFKSVSQSNCSQEEDGQICVTSAVCTKLQEKKGSCPEVNSLLLDIPCAYCLVVQVGEAAQILSNGKLVARAHCVARPTMAADVSRETMAVFLQPAWERPLMLPMWGAETALQAGGLSTDLETMIPPLTSRWRQGSTFAEFSQETTRQYYGVEGLQSRREQT
ncbi:unnamed protein product [Sphagnum jensenii]|uniref:Isopenicillin N synthase-like Fe(2+) 2OG dioxygenase domain-containing protein n=1 Tax=Sphagnum jensenii TaxID=128206 RepID=A0ABP0VGZ4_9BRYO